MCERLALKESIQLLYEQITGQRAHSGEAALREASEACRSVMDALDRARNTISTLLRFVGQEDRPRRYRWMQRLWLEDGRWLYPKHHRSPRSLLPEYGRRIVRCGLARSQPPVCGF